MGWFTVGKVTHTDRTGRTWERRVAHNSSTGEVERTFGTEQRYPDSRGTSRTVGHANDAGEALSKAHRDLKSTF